MMNCLCRFFQRGLHNPRIALGPVVAASGDQAHAVAVALQPKPIAVVLHFVEPVGAVGDGGGHGGKAEIKTFKHAAKIGV
jgi:hypothetical protein